MALPFQGSKRKKIHCQTLEITVRETNWGNRRVVGISESPGVKKVENMDRDTETEEKTLV